MKVAENGKVSIAGKEYPTNCQEINLDSLDLKQVPAELAKFSSVKRIYLLGNQITHIENFQNLPTLEEISLSYNPIRKIENLEDMPRLKDICLAKCPVHAISRKTYEYFKAKGILINYHAVDEFIKRKNVRIEE